MDSISNKNRNDFSIIFDEIDKFHIENPSFKLSYISDEDVANEDSIREFSNICEEINNLTNSPGIFMTFS